MDENDLKTEQVEIWFGSAMVARLRLEDALSMVKAGKYRIRNERSIEWMGP